jgi:hypothetical protein
MLNRHDNNWRLEILFALLCESQLLIRIWMVALFLTKKLNKIMMMRINFFNEKEQ